MKKTIDSLISLSLLILPVVVLAASIPPQPSGNITTLAELYGKIATFMWQAFAIVAIIMFIIAGILFLVAGGDPDRVKTARNAFLWGAVGVVAAILAFSAVILIQGTLQG